MNQVSATLKKINLALSNARSFEIKKKTSMQRIKMLLFELGIPRDLSLIDLSQEYRHFLCFFLTFSFAYIPL